eukprot:g405.t1
MGKSKRDVTATLLRDKGDGADKVYQYHESWFSERGVPNTALVNLSPSPSDANISFGDSVERPMNRPTTPPPFDVAPRNTLPSFVKDPARKSSIFSDNVAKDKRPYWMDPESEAPGPKYRIYNYTAMAGAKQMAAKLPAFGTATERDLSKLPESPPISSCDIGPDPRLKDNWSSGLKFEVTKKQTLPQLDPKNFSLGQNKYYNSSLHKEWVLDNKKKKDEQLELEKLHPFGLAIDSRLPEIKYDGREPKNIVPHNWVKEEDEPMAIFKSPVKRELTFPK